VYQLVRWVLLSFELGPLLIVYDEVCDCSLYLYEYAVVVCYSYSIDHFWREGCGLKCVYVLY